MALIPKDKITILKAADEVKEVAQSAPSEIQMLAIASAINNAANSGEVSVIVQEAVSDSNMKSLKDKGYVVTKSGHADNNLTEISWK